MVDVSNSSPPELTISDMKIGDTGYGVPWGFAVFGDKCYIDTAYDILLVSDEYLASNVKISKHDNRYIANLNIVREYHARRGYDMPREILNGTRFVECEDVNG